MQPFHILPRKSNQSRWLCSIDVSNVEIHNILSLGLTRNPPAHTSSCKNLKLYNEHGQERISWNAKICQVPKLSLRNHFCDWRKKTFSWAAEGNFGLRSKNLESAQKSSHSMPAFLSREDDRACVVPRALHAERLQSREGEQFLNHGVRTAQR